MKNTKHSLGMSALSLILCFSMLLGSTWAWFTDSVTSSSNVITAGNLDLEMYWSDDIENDVWYNVEDSGLNTIFSYDNWEPGYTDVKYIKLVNNGSLALNYSLTLTPQTAVGKLAEVINVYFADSKVDMQTRADLSGLSAIGLLSNVVNGGAVVEGTILPAGASPLTHPAGEVIVTLAMNMITSAGNQYQNTNSGDFTVTALATQAPYEKDSFGDDYDSLATAPAPIIADGASSSVTATDGKLSGNLTLTGNQVSAFIPDGTSLKAGADKLVLTVTPLKSTTSDITPVNDEILIPVDVHIEGVAEDNTKPIIIDLGEILPKYMNMGNYRLFHVENGVNYEMTLVDTRAELTAHNTYTYDTLTGKVSVAMASFSEVALVVNTAAPWQGKEDYTWYNKEADTLEIANADQLYAFAKIVGGMAQGYDIDNFEGKTVTLISDINLNGGKALVDGVTKVFYPIGYYNNTKDTGNTIYDRVPEILDMEGVFSSVSSFSGTFDGNGHTISDFYQNTWEMFGDHYSIYTDTPNCYKDAMGLFGYVLDGTVKNLTVDKFESDGELTPTGVIAAYADNSTFENIAVTNCHTRVYNTGNGGIIGIAGRENEKVEAITLKNITVDNTNKISALWGSYDVACGGLVGMYRGNADANGNHTGDTISFNNCHVSAAMDLYNDVCGNYQYYSYRYAGMIIGSVRHNTTNTEAMTIPNMVGISASGCTVNYGTWNDFYYCEFESNTKSDFTDDYFFSRIEHSELNFTDTNGNGKIDTLEERASVTGCKHNHTAEEDKRALYLPFHQLFTGYSWGVSSIGLEELEGIQNITVTIGQEESSVKFESKFNKNILPRVGNGNSFTIGSIFEAVDGATITNDGVWVTLNKIDENGDINGTFTPSKTGKWQDGTVKFSGTGLAKITIQDYNFCTPTVLYVEVVDADNATGAVSATDKNIVLLNNISSGFTVSGDHTFYGNGFTLKYTGDGQYLNNGLKQGIVNVSDKATLDNLRIEASIYPASYLYYEEAKKGPSTVDGDKTRYHYQLSAVTASGNATISNCYIYGARNNVFVNTGDVVIKDTVLECGTLSNIQIQSNASHIVTLNNVTTIQHQVASTVGTAATMLGSGVVVGPDTTENPKIVIDGFFKQYNWVTSDDKNAITNSTAKQIIDAALGASEFNHNVNGKTASNLGIIYLNSFDSEIVNNTGLPYVTQGVSVMGQSGKVCSLQNASTEQIYSDFANADRATVNSVYIPQFKYDETLGGQYSAKADDKDEYCYRQADTIYVMFPSGDTKTLQLDSLVNISKYSGYDLDVSITCKDSQGNAVDLVNNAVVLSNSDTYTVTYSVTDNVFYDNNGNLVENAKTYYWNVTLSTSLKDTAVPNAYFEFNADTQKMGYYKPSYGDVKQYLPFLAGLKIYDYSGKDAYLRFDGDTDFNKVAAVTITGYASNKASVEVKLTDGGIIYTQFLARANSGGGSTYTGKIKTSDNKIYFVTDSGTSNKDTTTTAAYWYVDFYKFTGNNGETIQSGQQTFNSTGSSASTPSGSFSTSINYTVNYDTNGGKCAQALSYATSASTAVTLPSPTRSGYIFAGWYTAASGGTKVGGAGDSYTPSANITLYAQWGMPCTVTYNANGGNCSVESEKYTGPALILPTPTRDGYWFIGWYDAANGGNKVGDAGIAYNPAKEITLYAHWQEQVNYTVTYNANSGSCDTASATYEGSALILPTATKEGHTFNGWYTLASGGTKIGNEGDSYIPSSNVTLYAQWKINNYTVAVTTSNATVTINGQSVSNGNNVSIPYGTQVTVSVTYSKSDSQSTTITGDDGTSYTSPFSMPAQKVTVNATSKDSTCITPDTLVTLANGTQVRVDKLTGQEQLLVWNHETGKLDKAPIAYIVDHNGITDTREIIHMTFSNGNTIKVIGEHVFFDATQNKYVAVDTNNVDSFISHAFVALSKDGTTVEKVELVSVFRTLEETVTYEVVSDKHLTCFTEGILSTSAYLDPLLNVFEIDTDTMAYNLEEVQRDIETYGLYTYADFEGLISEEAFELYNAQYLKIAIGKGYITWNDILDLIDIYFNADVKPIK